MCALEQEERARSAFDVRNLSPGEAPMEAMEAVEEM